MSILTDGYFDGARDAILNLQNPDGSIPWFKNGVIDPWNHLEAAMGLNLIGERVAAEQAISFLRDSQASDGSWLGQLGSAVPIAETLHQFTMRGLEEGHLIRDTNFIAYIATAIWHHYCLHGDRITPPPIGRWSKRRSILWSRCNRPRATFAGPRPTHKRRKMTRW